jgi:hypothetical protein
MKSILGDYLKQRKNTPNYDLSAIKRVVAKTAIVLTAATALFSGAPQAEAGIFKQLERVARDISDEDYWDVADGTQGIFERRQRDKERAERKAQQEMEREERALERAQRKTEMELEQAQREKERAIQNAERQKEQAQRETLNELKNTIRMQNQQMELMGDVMGFKVHDLEKMHSILILQDTHSAERSNHFEINETGDVSLKPTVAQQLKDGLLEIDKWERETGQKFDQTAKRKLRSMTLQIITAENTPPNKEKLTLLAKNVEKSVNDISQIKIA